MDCQIKFGLNEESFGSEEQILGYFKKRPKSGIRDPKRGKGEVGQGYLAFFQSYSPSLPHAIQFPLCLSISAQPGCKVLSICVAVSYKISHGHHFGYHLGTTGISLGNTWITLGYPLGYT